MKTLLLKVLYTRLGLDVPGITL